MTVTSRSPFAAQTSKDRQRGSAIQRFLARESGPRDASLLRVLRAAICLVLYAACDASANEDVVGPFTGATHRYVVDGIYLPVSNAKPREFGGDLDGDGDVDNQLGQLFSSLAGQADLSTHGHDMIVAGTIASSVEIVADDLLDDRSVSVAYRGTGDSPFVAVGGTFDGGWFRSNRTATTRVPGEAELHLPVFTEADPSLVSAIGLELFLIPDGNGGYGAIVHGAIPTEPAFREAVHRGIAQMVASDPAEHRGMLGLFDRNDDRAISFDELWQNSLIISMLAPDLTMDGRSVISIGFQAHLRPCATGACTDGLPFDHCFDRLLDGDETDLDCGGSCQRCEPNATCVRGEDCESTVCDTGRCGPASCFNGARDGFEGDIDCGGDCVADCANGQRCYSDLDCASGQCGKPCIPDDNCFFCCLDFDFSADTCHPPP